MTQHGELKTILTRNLIFLRAVHGMEKVSTGKNCTGKPWHNNVMVLFLLRNFWRVCICIWLEMQHLKKL